MNGSHADSLGELLTVLQASIAPVALISAVGLLLLSMSNRYLHVIDRARTMKQKLALSNVNETESSPLKQQLGVLYQRALLLRAAMMSACVCVFFVGITVFSLFISFTFQYTLQVIVHLSFLASVVSLAVSLLFFMRDISASLSALELELELDGVPKNIITR